MFLTLNEDIFEEAMQVLKRDHYDNLINFYNNRYQKPFKLKNNISDLMIGNIDSEIKRNIVGASTLSMKIVNLSRNAIFITHNKCILYFTIISNDIFTYETEKSKPVRDICTEIEDGLRKKGYDNAKIFINTMHDNSFIVTFNLPSDDIEEI